MSTSKGRKDSSWPSPSKVWFFIVAMISKLLLKVCFHHKVERNIKLEKHKPYVIISHHASLIDAIMMMDALYPLRFNTVIGRTFYAKKALKFIVSALKCIPKSQFALDLAAIRAMKSVTADNRAVALYPEGKVTTDGKQLYHIPLGTSKLIKMLDAEVIIVKSQGSFCAKPKYGKSFRFGPLRSKVDRVLTQEEVRRLCASEIHKKISASLCYNDNIYQQENNVKFKCKNPALGFHRGFYKCPKCGIEYQMTSTNTHLICNACGNSVEYTQYGRLIPDKGSIAFERLDLWNDYQRQACREELADPDFCLQTTTKCYFNKDGANKFEYAGEGIAYINKERVGYKGTFFGSPYEYSMPLKGQHTLTVKTREMIDLVCDEGILGLEFTEGKYAAKFGLLVEENFRLNELNGKI